MPCTSICLVDRVPPPAREKCVSTIMWLRKQPQRIPCALSPNNLYQVARELSCRVGCTRCMVRYIRGSCIIYRLLSSGNNHTRNISIHSTLSPVRKQARLTGFLAAYAVHSSCDSPNTPRRLALGASEVCLVGENPACAPSRYCGLWPLRLEYGMHDLSTTPLPPCPRASYTTPLHMA